MNKKIGIITWHYFTNFGSALQAYALQRSVQVLGYNVEILNYRDKKYGKYHGSKIYFQAVVHALTSKINRIFAHFSFPFQYFQGRYIKETKLVQDSQKLSSLCKKYDAIICGSDQIWAPNVFNPIYMLDFVPDDIPKISYAASRVE